MTAPAPLDLTALLDGAEARERKAHAEVVRLCEGGRWTMRIPVDEERDSDTVIEASLADVPTLIAELRKRDAALRAVEALAVAQGDDSYVMTYALRAALAPVSHDADGGERR